MSPVRGIGQPGLASPVWGRVSAAALAAIMKCGRRLALVDGHTSPRGRRPLYEDATEHGRNVDRVVRTAPEVAASRVHMHGGTYKAQGQMQPCIAQRTQTRRPECLPGPTGGQGILGRSATKTPTALARPECRPMCRSALIELRPDSLVRRPTTSDWNQ